MKNVLEDLKAKIQLNLMMNVPRFDYKGHTFNCYYRDYASPVDMMNYEKLEIVLPPELHMSNFHIGTQYDISTTRTQCIANKTSAAWKLAEYFVEEILPKVDFELEKIKYERDIDNMLSVLN